MKPPGPVRWKVIEPVGFAPLDRTAESLKVGAIVPRVTAGLAVVTKDGLVTKV